MTEKNDRISIHHIGGRSGSGAFPTTKNFQKDFIKVFYDADSECVEQAKALNSGSQSELYVLPYCLSSACQEATFKIAYDPYTSSLNDFNPEYSAYYSNYEDYDCILGESYQSMEFRKINVTTLDTIYQNNEIPAPPPDFLSIDTQGSEYDILIGGQQVVHDHVLAMSMEVEFHPLYKDQKLFGDLCNYLSGQGFYFVKLSNIDMASPYRQPIGLRAEGFQIYGDALFFRKPDHIEALEVDDEMKRGMFHKLAFIAIVHFQFEFGLECLKRSKNYDQRIANTTPGEEPEYIQFLRNLENRVEQMPKTYPRKFSAKFSFEESKRRFDKNVAVKPSGVINIEIKKTLYTPDSPVEDLLVKYGLDDLASFIKKTRLKQDAIQEFVRLNPQVEEAYNIVGYNVTYES
jgi:FkbM family methyltransferase